MSVDKILYPKKYTCLYFFWDDDGVEAYVSTPFKYIGRVFLLEWKKLYTFGLRNLVFQLSLGIFPYLKELSFAQRNKSFIHSTSNQVGLPPEFKHINKGRKRK